MYGLSQMKLAPPSSWHSNGKPFSPEKYSDGVESRVNESPAKVGGSGALVSTVHEYVLEIGPPLPAASTTRTWSV